VSWEKIGVTAVVKPAAHSSGLYLRIPKKTVEAYDLWTAEMVEYTIERAKQPEPGERTVTEKTLRSKKEGGRE